MTLAAPDAAPDGRLRHHPLLLTGGCRASGTRCECSCGWTSQTLPRALDAHLAFGQHLLDQAAQNPTARR